MEKVLTIIVAVFLVLLLPGTLFWALYDQTGFSNSFDLPSIGWWQSVVGIWIIGIIGAAFNGPSNAA